MNLDRIGTGVIAAAALWLGYLVLELPDTDVEVPWRNLLISIFVAVALLAVFPRKLELSGTVLAFAVLGICTNLAIFERDSIGVEAVVPVILVAIGIALRRSRLDLSDVVGVSALVAFGLGVVQPLVVVFALTFILIVNVIIWILNRVSRSQPA